jgi:hypothetical protein
MRIRLAALACLAASVAAAAPIESLKHHQPWPAPCSLSVDFGSICCGIDGEVSQRVRRAVIADKRVTRAFERGWGEEGEFTFCLVTRTRRDARALAARYGAWAKARPNPDLTKVALGRTRGP